MMANHLDNPNGSLMAFCSLDWFQVRIKRLLSRVESAVYSPKLFFLQQEELKVCMQHDLIKCNSKKKKETLILVTTE